MNRPFTALLLALSLCTCASAQEFSGGFRAGLNFISISGPLEGNGTGEFESASRTTGFHVGATFALELTDLVGIKADLMYSQKGGEITYDGPSTLRLYVDAADATGEAYGADRHSEIDVVNSYIDLPLTAYYRLGNFEIEGGLSAGFLINSRASGGVTFNNINGLGNAEIVYSVDGNYFKDDPGFGSLLAAQDGSVGPRGEPIPLTVGAYYDSQTDDKLYRRYDFGLVAGLAYYMNNGLYVGARYQYGLTDITEGDSDLRLTRDGNNTSRQFNSDDEDYTRSIQVSVGFRF